MDELLKYIKEQHEHYKELSTNELRKNGHSKNELWFSSKAESYRDILSKAKKLNLINE
jgi:hypothetical protein